MSEPTYKRHYQPSVTRPHHYDQGATQRLYEFENGHPTVSVIPVRLGDGTILLDRFEIAILEQSGQTHVLAYYITQDEVDAYLDQIAGL